MPLAKSILYSPKFLLALTNQDGDPLNSTIDLYGKIGDCEQSRLTSNFSLQYPYIFKEAGGENTGNHQLGDKQYEESHCIKK